VNRYGTLGWNRFARFQFRKSIRARGGESAEWNESIRTRCVSKGRVIRVRPKDNAPTVLKLLIFVYWLLIIKQSPSSLWFNCVKSGQFSLRYGCVYCTYSTAWSPPFIFVQVQLTF
jgi:hypothetical protein